MTSEYNREQADFWEEVAPVWLESERHVSQVGVRFGTAAMDQLRLASGQRVLDVGCGSGATTIELARRVGPEGTAVGIDISRSMVAAAVGRAETSGVANAEFVAADIQVSAFDESTYDAAFSQFGVMFFDDPPAAFTNVHRALTKNAPLTFSCWQNLFANEWMLVPGAAYLEATGTDPSFPGPDDPGPFSMSETDRITGVLTDAGFTEIDVAPHAEVIALPAADIGSLVRLSGQVGVAREFMAAADEATRGRVRETVEAALAERVEDGNLNLSAGAFIVRALA